jgi:hypothetical protein
MLLQAVVILGLGFLAAAAVRGLLGGRHSIARNTPLIAGLTAAVGLALMGRWAAAGLLGVVCAALFFVRPSQSPSAHGRSDPEADAARRLLGLGPTADADDVRGAYRRKISATHPDQGGSHAEAAALTAARDLLLDRLK